MGYFLSCGQRDKLQAPLEGSQCVYLCVCARARVCTHLHVRVYVCVHLEGLISKD